MKIAHLTAINNQHEHRVRAWERDCQQLRDRLEQVLSTKGKEVTLTHTSSVIVFLMTASQGAPSRTGTIQMHSTLQAVEGVLASKSAAALNLQNIADARIEQLSSQLQQAVARRDELQQQLTQKEQVNLCMSTPAQ